MKKKLFLALSFMVITTLAVFIAVSCDKDDIKPELTLDVTSMSVAAKPTGADTLIVKSNTSWTAASSQNWLTVSPTSGANDGIVIVTSQQNADTLVRTATITVSAEGVTSQTVTVTQNGAKMPTLFVSETSLNVAAEANSTSTFSITSDTSWTAESSENWLTVNPAAGSNNGTVTVTAQQNADAAARTATINVLAKGATTQTITVTQSGTVYSMVVSKKSLSLTAEANSTDTVTITSNTSWTISNPPSWLTVSPESGSNNGVVIVTANQSMTVGTARNVTLTISAESVTSQKIKVTQNGIPCGANDEKPCEVSGCNVPTMLSYASLPSNPYLPDPFMFMNGSRMTSKAEWACRRAEIAVQAQEYQYGYKPCTPYTATTGSSSGNSITVTVTDNGKTISFNCSITYPTTGSAPYPAVIGVGG